MKGSILELMLQALVGCVLLFGVTLLFSGAALRTPQQLLTAFGLCCGVVFAVEMVFRWFTDDHMYWDED